MPPNLATVPNAPSKAMRQWPILRRLPDALSGNLLAVAMKNPHFSPRLCRGVAFGEMLPLENALRGMLCLVEVRAVPQPPGKAGG